MTTTTDDLRRSGANAMLTPAEPQRSGETASNAMAAKAQALIQARYAVAYSRPRDIDVVRQRLLKACERPSFAAVAEYNKPIGGGVKGESIRFVEEAIRCMTNIAVETTTVYDDDDKRIVNVCVTDLESNTPHAQDVTISKTVERSSFKEGDVVLKERLNSKNKKVYTLEATDDDVLNKTNALISKAVRTQGLRVIPGDLVAEAMDVVHETMRHRDAKDPDAAKRQVYDGFAVLGVTVEQIKAYLGHDGATLTPKELATLRGMYTALKDGETTWREIMDNKEGATHPQNTKPAPQPTAAEIAAENERQAASAKAANDQALKEKAEAAARTASAAAQKQATADAKPATATEPQKVTKKEGAPSFEDVMRAISNAKNPDAVAGVLWMIDELTDETQKGTLRTIARKRTEALMGTGPATAKAVEPAAKAAEPAASTSTTRKNRPNFE